MSMFPRRGEIWLVELPNDPKVRPALVVSPDGRNERANGVLAVPITTNLSPSPTHVSLRAGSGGLTRESVARCENVSLLYKVQIVRGPLGPAMDAATMRAVEQAILTAFGIAR